MGKKLFKFLSDPGARVKGDGDAGASPTAQELERRGESATLFPGSLESGFGGEFGDQLAASEEQAARYVRPSIEAHELAPVDDLAYLKILSEQTGLRVVDLGDHPSPSQEVIRLLTAAQAQRLVAVPVYERDDSVVVVAVSDPANPMVTDDLRAIIDVEIEPVIARAAEIRERIERYYGMGDETLEEVASEGELEDQTSSLIQSGQQIEVNLSDNVASANAPPVIRLVDLLLKKAIKERASDIHIEPFPELIRIRYRVDGLLREIPSPKASMAMGICSRIKVLSGMDIAETRLPQDGRIKCTLEGRDIDLRVSTVPTVHGESIVMRVLDKSMMMIGIRQIGMTDQTLDRFMVHIRKPNGIVLVTGPTGCGKTTTLYAGLNEIKDPADKIITVEDPVEYRLDGILQININEGVGLTFARCLRSILRHDPDKVLVGEIRDIETAQIAVQASLTGHMVLSTLHTNSAASTITRLVDMGLEPFLLTSSLEAVIGQRLVRTICPKCRVPHTPTEEELGDFGVQAEELEDESFFRGQGCAECGHSGYHGRIGLYELLEVSDEMREMILDQASTDDIQALSKRNGMVTMREDGWMKIGLGLTTFEEVARDTPKDVASDAPAEPRIEEVPQLEEPEVETPLELEGPVQEKAQAQLDSKQMMIEEEAAAHVEGVGDANPGGS